ncbi:hypothetical protein L682_05590 [Aquipseudomonas alcaligenes OT 69]|nr:hypothetical protein L682_05590 [Pseudomonas alcaligenes OT 69]
MNSRSYLVGSAGLRDEVIDIYPYSRFTSPSAHGFSQLQIVNQFQHGFVACRGHGIERRFISIEDHDRFAATFTDGAHGVFFQFRH